MGKERAREPRPYEASYGGLSRISVRISIAVTNRSLDRSLSLPLISLIGRLISVV